MDQKERWQTPPEVWTPLFEEFGFDLDAAADQSTYRLRNYISPLNDALAPRDWPGDKIWLNPPYGRKLDPFVRKAAQQGTLGRLVVALIPFRCRADWWHSCVIGKAIEVRSVRKRIRFMQLDGSRGAFTASCDSCLVIWDGKPHTQTSLRSWSFVEAN